MRLLLRACDWLRHRGRLRQWKPEHAWGRRGEDLAHRFLQRRGYRIVARNMRLKPLRAELDLVARDGDTFVFVEVKTRASTDFGSPDQAVDAEKREQMIFAAGLYLQRAGASWERARFDIVSVLLDGAVRIEHIRDAFRKQSPL